MRIWIRNTEKYRYRYFFRVCRKKFEIFSKGMRAGLNWGKHGGGIPVAGSLQLASLVVLNGGALEARGGESLHCLHLGVRQEVVVHNNTRLQEHFLLLHWSCSSRKHYRQPDDGILTTEKVPYCILEAVLWIRIRIQQGPWIRIRIRI